MDESPEMTLTVIYESILSKWKVNPDQYKQVKKDFRKDIWRYYNLKQKLRYKAREVNNAPLTIEIAVQ